MRNFILIMGILSFLGFGCKQDSISNNPYKEESLNLIYNMLFCDNLELFNSSTTSANEYPWNIILSDKVNQPDLQNLANNDTIETRLRILAFNQLMNNKVKISNKELLGVIIEIGLDNGLDVFAAYNDGTARYINQSGKMIVWETRDIKSDSLIKELFINSENVVNNIGPWDKPRLLYPKKGKSRITFLVSDGLYFGEASTNDLFNDPMAGSVLNSGAMLMQYMMEKVEEK